MIKRLFILIALACAPLVMVPLGSANAETKAKASAETSHAEATHEDHAKEAGGHEAGVPMSVAYQAINFAIYIALLIYFLKNPVRDFFKAREKNYKAMLTKGESAKRDAEKKKREMQKRLHDLEASSDESLSQARAEATALKLQIQQEAEELANRLREESERSSALEIEKARNQLREEMLNQAVMMSRKLLNDKMAEPDQKRLQTEFVDKIQEVR